MIEFTKLTNDAQVLKNIPDSWSVQLISGYLISSGRDLLKKKKDSVLMRGLSREENFRVSPVVFLFTLHFSLNYLSCFLTVSRLLES